MSMDGHPSQRPRGELSLFAGAVLHELRTPLVALSGEVDLALRRQRSEPEYRDALTRIADRVNELVEITRDLGFLAERDVTTLPQRASLSGILLLLADRYASRPDANVTIGTLSDAIEIAGDERLVTRALTILLEHGSRHRRPGASIRLGLAAGGWIAEAPWIDLVLEADSPGFASATWTALSTPHEEWALHRPGLVRLHTAAEMLRACGGMAITEPRAGLPTVRIRLSTADAAVEIRQNDVVY